MSNSKNKSKFTRWIFDSYHVNTRGLALFRIFSALFILFFLMPSREMIQFLASSPKDFFVPPPGPMMLFNGFPSIVVFNVLYGLLVIFLIGVLLGAFTKTSSILTGVTLFAIKGFFYSVGKVDHDFLIIVTPILMAFSGWGKAYSLDFRFGKNDKISYSWTLSLLALCIGFMMFTAGFTKLLGGWLDTGSQATVGHFFNQYFMKGRQDLMASYVMEINNNIHWEILDYATVIFETGFLVAIIHPLTTRLFICFSIFFHFSIMMVLNISFLSNFIAYAAFFDWAWLDQKIKSIGNFKSKNLSDSLPVLSVPFLLLLIQAVSLIGSKYNLITLHSDLEIYEVTIVSFAASISIGYIVQLIRKIIRYRD